MLENRRSFSRERSARSRGAFPRLPFPGVPGGLVLALFAATPAVAQTPRLVVSTTSDVAASGSVPAVDDASLVAVAGGGTPAPQLFENHWVAQAGFVPTDLDAFGRLDSVPAGHVRSFAVSLLSNEGGFLDGDVLVFTPGGGLEVLFAEDELQASLGVTGASFDVDALDFDELGRLLFSLQSDLAGTVLGDVEDGDVLRLEFDGTATLVESESVIQSRFSNATGLGDPIRDVQGIEWTDGGLLVAVQSPSSYDGAVLDLTSTASILVEEDAVGLGGAEIDALTLATAGEELASVTASATAATPGETLHFEIHGRPNDVVLVVMAGGTGWVPFPQFPGWGGFHVDPNDPWLDAVIRVPDASVVLLDGNGFYEVDYPLPTAPVFGPGLVEGWTFQLLSLQTEISAPIRIEKL